MNIIPKFSSLFLTFLLFICFPGIVSAHLADVAIPIEPAEEAWLTQHEEVRLGVDPEFVPFEFIDDEGKYLGMCQEYVSLLEKRLGIKMLVTPGLTWNQAVEKAKAREIDILPCVGMTEERKKFFNYTQPYLSFYRVIITHREEDAFDNLSDLKGLKVGVQGNSSHHGFIKDNSDLEPVLFDTFEEALMAVSNKNIDAAIGNEAVAAYTINKNSIINLTMTRIAESKAKDLYLAVRNDWPELVTMLNKGLDSITHDEKEVIRKKWIALKVEKQIDYDFLAKVGGITFISILVLVIWNMQIRKQRELLRASEERFRVLAEASFEGIVLHEDGKILDVNENALRMFGYKGHEVICMNILNVIPTEYHMAIRNRISGGSEGQFEIEGLRKDGTRLPLEVLAKGVPSQGPRRIRIVAMRDITERKKMEDAILESLREKEMLIREINHRAKNNLAVIQSLLKLQSREITDLQVQGTLQDIQNRITSISMIHDRLSYSSNLTGLNVKEYFNSLAAEVFNTHRVSAQKVTLDTDVPDVSLDVDILIPCGLIVNELVSNSLKYAFPEGREGKLHVGLEHNGNGTYTLVVADNGVGIPADVDLKNSPSLGFQLVTSLTGQIGGTLELDRTNGTRFRISFEEPHLP